MVIHTRTIILALTFDYLKILIARCQWKLQPLQSNYGCGNYALKVKTFYGEIYCFTAFDFLDIFVLFSTYVIIKD